MFEAAPQSVFTPISSSAEYIGSHVVFTAVPPTHELPLGCDIDAAQQGESLLSHYLGYENNNSPNGERSDFRFTCRSGLGSQAANQRARSLKASPSTSSPKYIRTFSLLHSHIGDTGLKMNPVVDAVLQMATIESGPRFPIVELNLGFCSLTEESSTTIAGLIGGLPSLQRVTLVGNMFGNVINVLDNDALLGVFNAALYADMEPSVNKEIVEENDLEEDERSETETIEGSTPLANFISVLCECWSNHSNLAQVIVDPWLFERFPILEALRKQRIPLLRKQAASTGRCGAALSGYAKALVDMHEGGTAINDEAISEAHINRRASVRDDEADDFSAFAPSQRFQDIMSNVLRNAASFLSRPQSSGEGDEGTSEELRQDGGVPSVIDIRHVVSHLTLVELQAREALSQEESELFQSIQVQFRANGQKRKSMVKPASSLNNSNHDAQQQWWEGGSSTTVGDPGGNTSQAGDTTQRRDAARSSAFRKRINDFLALEGDMRQRHERRENDGRKKISQSMQSAMKAFFA